MVIVILIAPLLLAFVTALALLVPATQAAARWGTGGEDRPVEGATVVALLRAGLLAVRRVLRAAKAREPRFVQLFFALFAVVMVFVALEEISWGQHLLGFETPDAFKHNAQQELTLHNLPGLHGHTEYMRFGFGLAGLVGVVAGRVRRLAPIAASVILVPWFATIMVLGGLDLWVDYGSISWRIDRTVNLMSEFVEMLIGIAALGYVWLSGRALALRKVERRAEG